MRPPDPGRVPVTDLRTELDAGPVPLPRLLHQDPVAVLVLDVRTTEVVHASTGRLDLGGDVLGLPVPVADWVHAARLSRPGGLPYGPGDDPVTRAALGTPVLGELVWAVGDAGRRPLWATSLPLPASADDEHALLVLFDIEAEEAGAEGEAEARDRAIVAAGLSFTLSDPRLPDHPLVFVNPAFELTTGYSAAEALGRNCRFLQGPDTDPAAVQRIRDALERQEHLVVTLLNHRKDGTAFWNELSLSPVYDGAGLLTHYVGIQADVTARVLAEQARERTLAAERDARRAAESAQQRLALLAEATSMLAATLDVDEALRRLTALVVPVMADWCMVELTGSDDEARRFASRHVDPDKDAVLRRVEQLAPGSRTASSPVAQVLASGQPMLLADIPDAVVSDLDSGDALSQAYRELGTRSGVVVPLRARRQVLGVLTLVTADSDRTYDEDDLATIADLARRAALTVDNARLYQREHAVAEQLQRSLLPSLPDLPGVDAAARYLPGATAAQVGGDWYDLFALPDGALGVAIGDVMGHDLRAAAAMGQLRSVLRSYAWQGSGPAAVLDSLDQLVQGLGMAQLATAVYGRLDLPEGDRPGRLTMANAGHLPPVLRMPDGCTRLLDGTPSLLVGAALGIARDEERVELPPGSTLVMCTDGLVERRGLDPDEGLDRLRAAVERAEATTAEALCDELLATLAVDDLDDDVALLVLRVR